MARSTPEIVGKVVALPVPFEPSGVTAWPSATSKDTSHRATTPLYAARTPVTERSGSVAIRFRGGDRLPQIRLDHPWIASHLVGRAFGNTLPEIQHHHTAPNRPNTAHVLL